MPSTNLRKSVVQLHDMIPKQMMSPKRNEARLTGTLTRVGFPPQGGRQIVVRFAQVCFAEIGRIVTPLRGCIRII